MKNPAPKLRESSRPRPKPPGAYQARPGESAGRPRRRPAPSIGSERQRYPRTRRRLRSGGRGGFGVRGHRSPRKGIDGTPIRLLPARPRPVGRLRQAPPGGIVLAYSPRPTGSQPSRPPPPRLDEKGHPPQHPPASYPPIVCNERATPPSLAQRPQMSCPRHRERGPTRTSVDPPLAPRITQNNDCPSKKCAINSASTTPTAAGTVHRLILPITRSSLTQPPPALEGLAATARRTEPSPPRRAPARSPRPAPPHAASCDHPTTPPSGAHPSHTRKCDEEQNQPPEIRPMEASSSTSDRAQVDLPASRRRTSPVTGARRSRRTRAGDHLAATSTTSPLRPRYRPARTSDNGGQAELQSLASSQQSR